MPCYKYFSRRGGDVVGFGSQAMPSVSSANLVFNDMQMETANKHSLHVLDYCMPFNLFFGRVLLHPLQKSHIAFIISWTSV